MAVLVGYASSDEEEEEEVQQESMAKASTTPSAVIAHNCVDDNQAFTIGAVSDEQSSIPSAPREELVPIGPVPQNAVPLGPSLPPIEEPLINEPDSTQAPLSPYSANRALLRDLTLPSVPNMDIPPSPPGSPLAGANKKFEQFLELKKKGVHFNAKLEQSVALKNPSLMDKLMDFVEIDNRSQYSTTLSTDLWDPNAFPEWASRDKLKKAQEKIAKGKEAEKSNGGRTTVDFIPSTTPSSGSNPGPGGLSRGEKRKGGWK
ncbi:Fc.00g063990.m01.CDS01 [Cosmosporella sp. VM-42]